LLENTFDRKRIYANPSSHPNPKSKPNTNPDPDSNPNPIFLLKRNNVFGLTK